MLTVHKTSVRVGDAKGAVAQARYLLNEAESPHAFLGEYAGSGAGPRLSDGAPSAVWIGTDDALAIQGVASGKSIETEELALALQGLSATGVRIRTPSHDRVTSAEFHMAVPKSVSWAWAVARDDPQLRTQLERLMFEAARATTAYLLSTRDVVYLWTDEETGIHHYGPADGFVAAMVLHTTSRIAEGEVIPSPQLGIHVRVVAVKQGHGPLRTPNTEALFATGSAVDGGAKFRSIYVKGLMKLGFPIRARTGSKGRYFEIEGVSAELIEDGSGRTRQIHREWAAAEAERGEPLSGVEKAGFALKNRRGKDRRLSREVIGAGWLELAAARGLTLERLHAWRRIRRLAPLEIRLERARRVALEVFRERGPTVSLGEANAIVDEAGAGTLTIRDGNNLLADMQRAGEVIALEGGLVTTREIREHEQLVIGEVLRAARKGGVPVSPAAVERGIRISGDANGHDLDDEQQDAVRALCAGVGLGVLHGRAGTGKSWVLRALAEARRLEGWAVIAGAPDGKTRALMERDMRVPAYTLASLIPAVEQGVLRLTNRTVLVIDEASKVSADDWARIVPWLARHGIELILSGHVGQHDAILLAGVFAEIVRHRHDAKTPSPDQVVRVAELTKIRRHRAEWHKKLQIAVDMGHGAEAVELLRENHAITVYDSPEDAIGRTVDRWDEVRYEHDDPKATIMVVSGSNDDVDRLNELAQQRRLDAGELFGQGIRAVDRGYELYVGDIVVLSYGPYRPKASEPGGARPERVENGTIGIVTGIHTRRDIVRVRISGPDGEHREVDIDQRELRERAQRAGRRTRVPVLRLGYGYHTFPIQGETVQDVFYCLVTMPRKNGFYVGLTRQKGRLHVLVHRQLQGRKPAPREKVFEKLAKSISRTDTPELSIRRAVAPTLQVAYPLPDLRLVSRVQAPRPRERQRPTAGPAASSAILATLAKAFGPQRAIQFAEHARQQAPQPEELDDHALRQAVDRGLNALTELDMNLAARVRHYHDRQELLTSRIDNAAGEAARFDDEARLLAKLEESGVIVGRREARKVRKVREALTDTANTYREIVDLSKQELDEVVGAQQQLREDANHPDTWLERHAAVLIDAISADKEHSARQSREVPATEPQLEPAGRQLQTDAPEMAV